MPSPTTRNTFRKPDPGGDTNTWGTNLNSGIFDLVDASLDGWTVISTTGTTTLSSTQYVANQSRMRILKYTGATSGTLVIPSVEKWYIVWATQADCVISNGGDSVTVPSGTMAHVITDGTDINIAETRSYTGDIDMNGNKIVDLSDPVSNQDAATKKYVDDTAFEMAAGSFPGLTGNAGRPLVVNSSEDAPEWSVGWVVKTGNFTADRGGLYLVNTVSGAVTATLPASPQNGDEIRFADGGFLTGTAGWGTNALTVARNGKTIMSLSENLTCNGRGQTFGLVYQSGDWRVVA